MWVGSLNLEKTYFLALGMGPNFGAKFGGLRALLMLYFCCWTGLLFQK